MPITSEQRGHRREVIGSSDSPAILGVDPYKTAYAVYVEKIHQVAEISSEATELGNDFEEALVRWAVRREKLDANALTLNASFRLASGPFGANLDGLVLIGSERIGIEAKVKTSEHVATRTPNDPENDTWGEPGTDQVPLRVMVQCLHQIEVANLARVIVPVLYVQSGRLVREIYYIEPNHENQRAILERGREFWQAHVLAKVPPPTAPPSLELLARIQRVPGKIVDIPQELVAEYILAAADATRAIDEKKAAKAAMLTALGDAEVGDFGVLSQLLTYFGHARRTVSGKVLKNRAPEIYEEIVKKKTTRRIGFANGMKATTLRALAKRSLLNPPAPLALLPPADVDDDDDDDFQEGDE